jgi:hypothetical protein
MLWRLLVEPEHDSTGLSLTSQDASDSEENQSLHVFCWHSWNQQSWFTCEYTSLCGQHRHLPVQAAYPGERYVNKPREESRAVGSETTSTRHRPRRRHQR